VAGSGSGPVLGKSPHMTVFSTSGGRVSEIYIGPQT